MTLLTVLAACTATPDAPTGELPAANPPQVEVNPTPTEQALLAQGMPKPSGPDTAMAALAEHLGMGLVRCPVQSIGLIRRVHGMPRDKVLDIGPKMMVEVEDDVPWHPIFDEIAVVDRWTSFLARPGETTAYARLRERTLSFTFPAASAGETVRCTSVEPVEPRVVTGRVEPSEAPMFAIGCTTESTKVAKDGTFVLDARVPCSLWVEVRDGRRSAPVQIVSGDGKLELGPVSLEADALQTPEGAWTEAGKAALRSVVREGTQGARDAVTHVAASVDGNAAAGRLLTLWNGRLAQWEEKIEEIEAGLDGKIPL